MDQDIIDKIKIVEIFGLLYSMACYVPILLTDSWSNKKLFENPFIVVDDTNSADNSVRKRLKCNLPSESEFQGFQGLTAGRREVNLYRLVTIGQIWFVNCSTS